MMKILLVFFVLLFLIPKFSNAELIDYAVEIKTGLSFYSDLTIEICDSPCFISDETWEVVGACSNSPNLKIEVCDSLCFFSDKRIEICEGLCLYADKKICITNANQLEVELLKKLKLID